MALTNIELYEALKKDVSEESARMIAEVIPAAADLATKADIAATQADIARLELAIERMDKRIDQRISAVERRFFLLFAVPLWGAVGAGIVKYVMS